MIRIRQAKEIERRKSKQYLQKNKLYFLEYWGKRKGKGYIPLNEYFEDSDGHHIDHEHVVYIPIFIHRCIPHHHKDPDSMWVINCMALLWLFYGSLPEVEMKLPDWIFMDKSNGIQYKLPKKPNQKILQKKLF